MARQHVDYTTSALLPPQAPADDGLDTGSADATAIRPVADGQAANSATFKRPSENLRTRTEKIRAELEDLKYLNDADRALLLTGPGSITWNGAGPGTSPLGTFSLDAGSLTVRPFLAPATSLPSRLLIAANTVGQITIRTVRQAGTAPRAYSGANDISIDFQPVNTGNGLIVVTATGTPANNVHVQYDNHPTSGTSVDLPLTGFLAQFNGSSVALSLGLEAVIEGGGTPPEVGFPTPPASVAATKLAHPTNGIQPSEQLTRYMSGAADAEKHVIPYTQLTAFFADPLNAMLDGDTLCIRYDDLVMSPTVGGRRQSIADLPENNLTIPVGSLFLLRRFPERLPLAIPVCAVADGKLIFINGRTYGAGETGPLVAAGASYQGSPAAPNSWADGTVVSGPVSFESALDTIIQTLGTKAGGTPGAIKVGFTPSGNFDVASTNVKAALEELDSAKAELDLTNTFTKTNTFTPSVAATRAIVATGNTSGVGVEGTSGTGPGIYGHGNNTPTTGPGVVAEGQYAGIGGNGLIARSYGSPSLATLQASVGAPYPIIAAGGAAGGGHGHAIVGIGTSSGCGIVGVGDISVAPPAGFGEGVLGKGYAGGAGGYFEGGNSGGMGVGGYGIGHGVGVDALGGDTNGTGITAQGGGLTGIGVIGTGASDSGTGVRATGGGTGIGLEAQGGVLGGTAITATGGSVAGYPGGVGIHVEGGAGLDNNNNGGGGIHVEGGAPHGSGTGGLGIYCEGGTNATALEAVATGTGWGADIHGGTTGVGGMGVRAIGGGTAGRGVEAFGSGSGAGVFAQGGANGNGVRAQGGGSASGILSTAGGSAGYGVDGQGTTTAGSPGSIFAGGCGGHFQGSSAADGSSGVVPGSGANGALGGGGVICVAGNGGKTEVSTTGAAGTPGPGGDAAKFYGGNGAPGQTPFNPTPGVAVSGLPGGTGGVGLFTQAGAGGTGSAAVLNGGTNADGGDGGNGGRGIYSAGLTGGTGGAGVGSGTQGIGGNGGHGGHFVGGGGGTGSLQGIAGIGVYAQGGAGRLQAPFNLSGVGVYAIGGAGAQGIVGSADTDFFAAIEAKNAKGQGFYTALETDYTGNPVRCYSAYINAGTNTADHLCFKGVNASSYGRAATFSAAGTNCGTILIAPRGTDPASPVDGDIWVTSAGALKIRLNGTVRTVNVT